MLTVITGKNDISRAAVGIGIALLLRARDLPVLPSLPVELPPQSSDGSFRNSVNLVKEDDPLIATTFALYVMARE